MAQNSNSSVSTGILIPVGFHSYVVLNRIVAICDPCSMPMRRLRENAQIDSRLLDLSHGRKTRSILVTDCNQVILSSIATDTMAERITSIVTV